VCIICLSNGCKLSFWHLQLFRTRRRGQYLDQVVDEPVSSCRACDWAAAAPSSPSSSASELPPGIA